MVSPRDSILHAYIQPDAFVSVARKGSIRTKDHHIGARVDSQAFQGCLCEAVFVGKGQFAFDARNILARHHPKGTIGGQFGVQHFGKGRRQPVVFRVARQVAEAKDCH